MKMTEQEYHNFCDNYAGYCTICDDVTRDSDTEPDAENYFCPDCGNDSVLGIELALLSGFIEIEWDEG